jgi:heme-degrading monooxygenase HmoA
MFTLVHHKMADFSVWKEAFDSMEEARRGGGVTASTLYRDEDSPNEVFILLEWNDPAGARGYFKSDAFKAALKRGGVTEEPDVWFLSKLG